MLDAYQDRLSLIADLQQLRMQRGGTLCGHRRRRQPRRRRSLLKPRPKSGILAPSRQQPYGGSASRTVRVPTWGGQLAEIALPPDTGDTRRRTTTGRRTFPLPRPEDSNLPDQRNSVRRSEDPTTEPGGEQDFRLGQ